MVVQLFSSAEELSQGLRLALRSLPSTAYKQPVFGGATRGFHPLCCERLYESQFAIPAIENFFVLI
jgi:hypothetical protein